MIIGLGTELWAPRGLTPELVQFLLGLVAAYSLSNTIAARRPQASNKPAAADDQPQPVDSAVETKLEPPPVGDTSQLADLEQRQLKIEQLMITVGQKVENTNKLLAAALSGNQ